MVAADFARNPHDAGKARAHATADDDATNAANAATDDHDDAHLTSAKPPSHAA